MRLVAGYGWDSLAAAVAQDCGPHPKFVIAATGVFPLDSMELRTKEDLSYSQDVQSMLEDFESSFINESTQRLHRHTRSTLLTHLGLRAHLAQTHDCDKTYEGASSQARINGTR